MAEVWEGGAMRLIIAGSRGITSQTLVNRIVAEALKFWEDGDPEVVLSGGARGVDFCGEVWAGNRNIEVEVYHADWARHGRKAGYLRNVSMAENASCLLAVWDYASKGTKHMIDIANERGLRVHLAPP